LIAEQIKRVLPCYSNWDPESSLSLDTGSLAEYSPDPYPNVVHTNRNAELCSGIVSERNPGLTPFIEQILNPDGDGNCGPRAISMQVYGNQNSYDRVKQEMYALICTDSDYWRQKIGGDHAYAELCGRLQFQGTPCPYRYWFCSWPEFEIAATLYNRPMVVVSPEYPLGNGTTVYRSVSLNATDNELLPLFFAFVNSNHYVAIKITDPNLGLLQSSATPRDPLIPMVKPIVISD